MLKVGLCRLHADSPGPAGFRGSLCWCQALGLGNRGTTLTPTPIAPSMEEPLSSRFACEPSEFPFPECADMHRVYKTDPAPLACMYHKAQQRLRVQTELGSGQAVQTTAVGFVHACIQTPCLPACLHANVAACMQQIIEHSHSDHARNLPVARVAPLHAAHSCLMCQAHSVAF